nr:hypothetical protein [Thiocystis violacea]
MFEIVPASGPEAEIVANQAAVAPALAAEPVIIGQVFRRDTQLGSQKGDAPGGWRFIMLGKSACGLHELELDSASQASWTGHTSQQGQFVRREGPAVFLVIP